MRRGGTTHFRRSVGDRKEFSPQWSGQTSRIGAAWEERRWRGGSKVTEPGEGFAGVRRLFAYVNADGLEPRNACGPAGCATLLTYCELLPAHVDSLWRIERTHPPDLVGGRFGTSPWRIASALRDYGVPRALGVNRLRELREAIADRNPVLCVIQNEPGLFGMRAGAHWLVAHAYDRDGIYVTNFGPHHHVPWARFEALWSGAIARLARVKFRGVTCALRALPTAAPAVVTP